MILLQPAGGKKAQLLTSHPVAFCPPSSSFASFINGALFGLFHGFMTPSKNLA